MVLAEEQVIAVLHRTERRRHEDGHEAVLDEIEVLYDVRPQKAEGIREGREPEAGPQLLGDRGAADQVALFEDQGPEAPSSQVGAVHQPVVDAADHDRVVRLAAHAVFRSGLKNGSLTTWAATFS